MHTTDSRPDARDRYRSVVSTVQHNTGDPQPPFAREATIVLICAGDGQFTPDGVRDALQAAVENDDLLRARRDGPRYAAVDEPSLVQAVQAEAGRDDTDHQFVARCNDHLDQLREAS